MPYYGRGDDGGGKRENGAYLVSSRPTPIESGEWRDLLHES